MITIYDKTEHDEEFREIKDPCEGCWIHVEDATTNDINQISKLIDLEYTDIYDCLDTVSYTHLTLPTKRIV